MCPEEKTGDRYVFLCKALIRKQNQYKPQWDEKGFEWPVPPANRLIQAPGTNHCRVCKNKYYSNYYEQVMSCKHLALIW